jgi:hypothetical protein
MKGHTRRIRVLIAMILALLFASIAEAAFPRLLMVFGKPLSKPIIVEEPLEVVDVFEGTHGGANQSQLEGRAHLELALFWGNVWNNYMNAGKSAKDLKPEDVTPFDNIPIRGRFYPACGSSAAQITLTNVGADTIQSSWLVSEKGLKVLEKLGVPTKSECR